MRTAQGFRIATSLAGVALLCACGSSSPTVGSNSPSSTNSTISSPAPSAIAAATPDQLATAPIGAAFACTNTSGGLAAGSDVMSVKVGQHPGYDRFVIAFGGAVPAYEIDQLATSTVVSGGGRGNVSYTLDGTSAVQITLHSVTNWTTYSGPTDFHPKYTYLQQALQVQNYEGYQTWALGVNGGPCLRVFTLQAPSRLVVDVGQG